MTIRDKINSLIRRRPPTEEEVAARTEAEKTREQGLQRALPRFKGYRLKP